MQVTFFMRKSHNDNNLIIRMKLIVRSTSFVHSNPLPFVLYFHSYKFAIFAFSTRNTNTVDVNHKTIWMFLFSNSKNIVNWNFFLRFTFVLFLVSLHYKPVWCRRLLSWTLVLKLWSSLRKASFTGNLRLNDYSNNVFNRFKCIKIQILKKFSFIESFRPKTKD